MGWWWSTPRTSTACRSAFRETSVEHRALPNKYLFYLSFSWLKYHSLIFFIQKQRIEVFCVCVFTQYRKVFTSVAFLLQFYFKSFNKDFIIYLVNTAHITLYYIYFFKWCIAYAYSELFSLQASPSSSSLSSTHSAPSQMINSTPSTMRGELLRLGNCFVTHARCGGFSNVSVFLGPDVKFLSVRSGLAFSARQVQTQQRNADAAAAAQGQTEQCHVLQHHWERAGAEAARF